MKKILSLIVCCTLIFTLCACGDVEVKDSSSAAPSSAAAPASATEVADNSVTEITLSGNSASIKGRGASVNGNIITISSGGQFSVSGKLDNGRIIINTGEDAVNVTLTLNGADITCADNSAIEVENAKKLHIVIADGTENSIISGNSDNTAPADDAAKGAAIFSSDDLKISGEGTLKVGGYINNGIASKNDIKISGGNITVISVNNGIRGNDSVVIEGGTLSVESVNDGIKTTTTTKDNKGSMTIEGGMISIISAGDGLSAATDLTVNGGIFNITTTGNNSVASSKAIKAAGSITVNSGDFDIKTTGKAISCPGNVFINDGDFSIESKDDAISSDINVAINGGLFTIVSSNDGIKSGVKGGDTGSVSISAGSITISASLDPIDAKGEVNITGGELLASGNSKSIKKLTSTVPVVTFNFDSQIAKGREIVVSSENGDFTKSMTPMYGYKLIVYAGADLVSGNTYSAVSGSTSASVAAK